MHVLNTFHLWYISPQVEFGNIKSYALESSLLSVSFEAEYDTKQHNHSFDTIGDPEYLREHRNALNYFDCTSQKEDIPEYFFLSQEEYIINSFDWLHLQDTIYPQVFIYTTGREEVDTSFFKHDSYTLPVSSYPTSHAYYLMSGRATSSMSIVGSVQYFLQWCLIVELVL